MKNIYTKKNLDKLYLIRLVEEEIARRYKKEKMLRTFRQVCI